MLRLGWRLFQRDGSMDAAFPLLEKAKELATRLDDKASLAETLVHLQALSVIRGDLRSASEHARAAAPLLEDGQGVALRVLTKELDTAQVLLRGNLREACRRLGDLGVFRAPEEGSAVDGQGPQFVGMALGAYALWLTGKPDDAVALARRGYQAAEALDDAWERAALLADWAMLHAWRREPAKAREIAERSLALAKPGAFGVWRNRAEWVLRWAEVELAPAISNERADELLSGPGQVTFGQTMSSLLYVAMSARLGRVDRALLLISDSLASIERTEERWLEPEFHRIRGEIVGRNDPLEAERSIALAIDIARKHSATSLELRAMLGLHALVSGEKKKRVRKDIARVLSLITGGEGTPDIIDARRVLET